MRLIAREILWRTLALLGVCTALSVAAHAQLGDGPGERQLPIVPAAQIPPAPALAPEQALRSFVVAPGYQLELVACEPLIQDPVAFAFGPDGRLWVVEMRGFMPDLDGTGEDQPVGRVVVLRDRDGDGRYDESQVFLDQLVLPRALLLVGEGVLVGAPPELAFWRDTDGDGKADRKEVIATDYGVRVDPKRPQFANPELAPNGLLWARDNWIYSAAYPKKFRYRNGGWQTAPTAFRGQWGLSQDEYGRFFHNSNADQLRVDLIPAEDLLRNPHYPRLAGAGVNAAVDQLVWPARVNPGINRGYRPENLRDGRLKQFTAACAPWVYGGDLLPDLRGDVFVAEPAANFVRRNLITSEAGAVRAQNAYEGREFIASTDERFRPVNFSTGPDGALYLVDLYRGVLQHRLSLTSYLRNQSLERDLVGPQHLGRIYRVIPAGARPDRATRIAALSTTDWVARLAHPNSWWRETAQQRLVERGDPASVPSIRALASTAGALGRLHAWWTLDGIGALERADVLHALADDDPRVLVAALRLSEKFLSDERRNGLLPRLTALLTHPSADVQRQALLTLGGMGDPALDLGSARVVLAYPQTPFLREALLSGLSRRELPLLEALCRDPAGRETASAANALVAALAQGILASRDRPAIERALALAADQSANAAMRAAALLDGLVAGAASERRPIIFSGLPSGWAELAHQPAHQKRLARLGELFRWPGQPGSAARTEVKPLTAAQQARFANGREIFTAACAACHQATGAGLEGLAPPLLDSEWVLGSPERLGRILLHGLSGPIKVRGRTYSGDMPAFGGLDDEQIAAVLTYIRHEWGHAAAPVEPAAVQAIRAATSGHSGAWSAEELRWVK